MVATMAPTETKNIRYSHFFQLFVFREEWGPKNEKSIFAYFSVILSLKVEISQIFSQISS